MQKKRTTKPAAKTRPKKKAPPAEKKQSGLKRRAISSLWASTH